MLKKCSLFFLASEKVSKVAMKTSVQDVVASGNFELLKTLAHSTLQVGILEDILVTNLRTLFLRLACLVLWDSARLCEEQLALQAVARWAKIYLCCGKISMLVDCHANSDSHCFPLFSPLSIAFPTALVSVGCNCFH